MKYISIAIVILASAISATAQSQDTFLDFNAGYSIHDVNTDIKSGDKKLGGGVMLYGGFGHFFSDHWGITVGARLCTAKTTNKLNWSDHVSSVEDPQLLLDTKVKDLDVHYLNMKERTSESVIYLPVGFAFRQGLGDRLTLEARITAEPGYVMQQKYKTVSGEINVSNIYINTFDGVDVQVSDVNQLHQYGAGDIGSFSGDADMKKFIFATGASLGVVVPLSQRMAFTASLYGSYSFTDQKNKDFPHVYDGVSYVGVAQSSLCSKIHPFTAGVAVGVRVFIGKDKQRPEPSEPIEIEKPDTSQQVVVQTDVKQEVVQEVIAPDTSTVDIRQIIDIARNEPEPAVKVEEEKPANKSTVAEVRKMLVDIEPITFALGASQSAKDSEKIDEIAAIMKSNPDMKFRIVGHTCNLGSLEVNRVVGQKRADSLRDELLKRGVSPSQLSSESRWYKEPIVPNTSEANRQKNRRVEVEVVE